MAMLEFKTQHEPCNSLDAVGQQNAFNNADIDANNSNVNNYHYQTNWLDLREDVLLSRSWIDAQNFT